ncbi:hypothetical protein [Mesorhizobium temperatum]|uniref:Uncharacterized protein n=1 Tax=Mesorhizobium temperatum TaxID=241416 RepID=A0A271LS40_9HYPH|nr:hypothetical protein [Mesorhizobium temperatum]PAQ10992.1 hypothetical protein CIT26_06790 [Mesorhizobium temperatum]
MASNQELFANGLAANQKVIGANNMANREVYGLLHRVLMAEGPGRFVSQILPAARGPKPALPLSGRSYRQAAIPLIDPMADVRSPRTNSRP